MPLARKRRIDGVELRAFEAFRDEHIGDIVCRAADDGIVVATETGIRIRPAGAAERRIDSVLALGRDDRLRRLRPSGAVDGGEFGLEQLTPALDQGGESRWAGCGDRIEIEMRAGRKNAFVPACRERASADQGAGRAQSERCAQKPLHGPPVALVERARNAPDRIILTSRASAASTFPARASPSVAARLEPHEPSWAPSSFGALTVSAGLTIVPPAEIVRPSAGGRALSRVAAWSVDRTGGNK